MNAAIKKPLIATIEFTTNYHVLLMTKETTTTSAIIKHHRQAIEEAARSTILAATGLRQDKICHMVIIYGISTTISSTPEGFNPVKTEIEEFNPGLYLLCPPRCLTTETQWKEKVVSAIVITLVGKDTTEKVLSSSLSLFSRMFKSQCYLSIGPNTECSRYLAFDHHSTQSTGTSHCAICTQEYSLQVHSCGRSQCTTSGKACLHTIKYNICNKLYPATSTECTTYMNA
ncbi:hypothetical protein L873DRAFT_1790556 [Choiromyces venosus 120613-1]|uniref:Uncharacterized protein n=1 Tax=Choiromyces venosus 120613-1 TaxID=1336337 RepID=A0A3N4JNM9_9PEZI|nr:hypothetical protein L873DRAFT_1790556 [Choiromyces venosus 120613-1]